MSGMKTLVAIKTAGNQPKSVELAIEPGKHNNSNAVVVSPGPQHDHLEDAEIEVWVIAPKEEGEDEVSIEINLEESALGLEGLQQWIEFFSAISLIAADFESYFQRAKNTLANIKAQVARPDERDEDEDED